MSDIIPWAYGRSSFVGLECEDTLNVDETAILPTELLLKILSYLDFLTLCKVTKLVCRRWSEMSSDPLLIKNCYLSALHDSARVLKEESLKFQQNPHKRIKWDENAFFSKTLIADLRMGSRKYTPNIESLAFPANMNVMDLVDQKFFFASRDKSIYICDCKLKTLRKSKEFPDENTCIQVFDKTIYCGSLSGHIHILNENSGEEIMSLEGHPHQISALFITDERIYSASWDHTIRIWDRGTGEELKQLQKPTITSCLTVADNKIYSGSWDNIIRIWDAETGELIQELKGHSDIVNCIKVAGNKIYSGSRDHTIRVWNKDSGALVRILKGHSKLITSLEVFNKKIISGSLDAKIKIWDEELGIELRELTGHGDRIAYLKAENGKIISGSLDQTLRVWDFNWQEPIS